MPDKIDDPELEDLMYIDFSDVDELEGIRDLSIWDHYCTEGLRVAGNNEYCFIVVDLDNSPKAYEPVIAVKDSDGDVRLHRVGIKYNDVNGHLNHPSLDMVEALIDMLNERSGTEIFEMAENLYFGLN